MGKSLLVSCMFLLLLDMSEEEVFEVVVIYLVKGEILYVECFLMCYLCFFYYISFVVVFIGGGFNLVLGEILLVYNGILFLDELFEFGCKVLDVLCEFFEIGDVYLLRVLGSVMYLVNFQLVVVMNLSLMGDIDDNCLILQQQFNYLNCFFGLFFDRIDIQVEVFCLFDYDLLEWVNMFNDLLFDIC